MKRAKGLGFFIIAALIIALTVVSVFGIFYYYGDIKFTTVKGLGDVAADADLGQSAKVVFCRSDAAYANEGLTQDEIDAQTDKLLEALLTRISMSTYRVTASYADHTRGCAVVDLSPQAGQNKYDFDLAMSNLTSTGHLVVVDSAYSSLGYSSDNVIFDNDQLSHVDVESDSSGAAIIVLTLNDEGTKIWSDYTEANVDGTVSVWMDSSCVCEYKVSQVVRNGKMTLSFSDSETSGSYSTAQIISLAYSINAGNLPFATEVSEDSVFIAAAAGANTYKTALIALGAALLLLCALLIVRYRLEGVIITVCALGEVAVISMIFTGFIEAFSASQMQLSGLIGAAAALTLTLCFGAAAAETGKRGMDGGNSLDNSLRAAYRSTLAPMVDASAVTLLGALVINGAWSYFTDATTSIVRPIINLFTVPHALGTDSLTKMLITGSICGVVMIALFGRLMTRSASRAFYMRDAKLYGGKNNG